MNGAEFRALVRFSTKDDVTLVSPGETCERLSPAALQWAIETGRVERIAAPAAPEAREEV